MGDVTGLVTQLLASAGLSVALVTGLGWLFRTAIQTRLKVSVEHEFNAKMAALQSELRESEEQFKDELRGRAAVMQALQGGALATQASRQAAAEKRRLEAIDQLWAAMSALRPALLNSQLWKRFDCQKCISEAATNPKFREVWGVFGDGAKEAVDTKRGDEARPHVTKLAWAYFEAYRSTLAFYTIRVVQLQHGIAEDRMDHEGSRKLCSRLYRIKLMRSLTSEWTTCTSTSMSWKTGF